MASRTASGTALAIDGGTPVRSTVLPYSRQWIDEKDLAAVERVLRSDWLTTGPAVPEFERQFAQAVGAREAVAVSSGTAALHAAVAALGIGPGDEVIVPAMTFAASANCVVYQSGTPVFADVDPGTLLIDPAEVARRRTARTRAVIAVDYAGQPCDYGELRSAAGAGVTLISDACHALGGARDGRKVGALADLSTFSMHPAKHVTSGEGGVITTDDVELARRMRVFRNHGITTDHREREKRGAFTYEMTSLGYNYRLTDFQCALAGTQLERLPGFLERRRKLAALYDEAFRSLPGVRPLTRLPEVEHAYHLYVVRLDLTRLRVDRGAVFRALRAEGIGANVHYVPVHRHPFYRERFGTAELSLPAAEAAYDEILTLPLFPSMEPRDVADVVEAMEKVLRAYRVTA